MCFCFDTNKSRLFLIFLCIVYMFMAVMLPVQRVEASIVGLYEAEKAVAITILKRLKANINLLTKEKLVLEAEKLLAQAELAGIRSKITQAAKWSRYLGKICVPLNLLQLVVQTGLIIDKGYYIYSEYFAASPDANVVYDNVPAAVTPPDYMTSVRISTFPDLDMEYTAEKSALITVDVNNISVLDETFAYISVYPFMNIWYETAGSGLYWTYTGIGGTLQGPEEMPESFRIQTKVWVDDGVTYFQTRCNGVEYSIVPDYEGAAGAYIWGDVDAYVEAMNINADIQTSITVSDIGIFEAIDGTSIDTDGYLGVNPVDENGIANLDEVKDDSNTFFDGNPDGLDASWETVDPPVTSVRIENDDSRIVYGGGTWTIQENIDASNGDISVTGDYYAYAKLEFEGSGIRILAEKDILYDDISVYIDDVYQGKVSEYGATQNQAVVYEKLGLAEGVLHDITVKNATIGAYANIDAFEVLSPEAAPYSPPEAAPITGILEVVEVGFLESLYNEVCDFTADVGNFFDTLFDFSNPIDFSPFMDLGADFTNKFPFSLPWDLKRSVESMTMVGDLPPVALQFYDPSSSNKTIPVNFEWPAFVYTLAGWTRPGFLISFGLGLVWGTSKLFGGAK